MKEFKMRRWYPSLPEDWKHKETVVVVERTKGFWSVHPSLIDSICETTLESQEIENNPEFWEELKPCMPEKKEYNILKLSTGKDIFLKYKNLLGETRWSREGSPVSEGHYKNLKVGDLYGNQPLEIYSIYRLSDGKVFTVGDTFLENTCKVVVTSIRKFITKPDGGISIEGTNTGRYSLNSLTHHKSLFTTEDNVEVYEGDMIYQVSVVDKVYDIHPTKARKEITPPPSYFKYFSTRKVAEEYVIRNKPVLSLNDVYKVCNIAWERGDGNPTTAFDIDLMKLVKQKL